MAAEWQQMAVYEIFVPFAANARKQKIKSFVTRYQSGMTLVDVSSPIKWKNIDNY